MEEQAPVLTGPYPLGRRNKTRVKGIEEETIIRSIDHVISPRLFIDETSTYFYRIGAGRRKMLSFDLNIPLINFFHLTSKKKKKSGTVFLVRRCPQVRPEPYYLIGWISAIGI